MAKEIVTLKFIGSPVHYFTAAKPGRRDAEDVEKLHKRLVPRWRLRRRIKTLAIHRSGDDRPGLIIIMSLARKSNETKVQKRVKKCFARVGYTTKELPGGVLK